MPEEADRPELGFIGLGAMGGAMARNLLRAGYRLAAFDIDGERLAACVAEGAKAAADSADVSRRSEVVLTSLYSSEVAVEVYEGELVPNAREGQTFIDLGTTAPPETRRLAGLLAERGATLVDAPVSGGGGGARDGTLRIFVGGDEATAKRLWCLFEVMGRSDRITYCGLSGSGQILKGVNQLWMGVPLAAYLEAVAFGVRAGVPVEVIREAYRDDSVEPNFLLMLKLAAEGRADEVTHKFPEFPYFISEAREKGFPMPILEGLYGFLEPAERTVRDNMGRPNPSLWSEMIQRPRE